MKLATVFHRDETSLVTLRSDGNGYFLRRAGKTIADIGALFSDPRHQGVIDDNLDYMNDLVVEDVAIPAAAMRYKPPVLTPEKILGVSTNYPGIGRPTEFPLFFPRFRNTLIGHEDFVILPPHTGRAGWEVELAVVIGRTASCVERSVAMNYVGGYTIANDVTDFDETLQSLIGVSAPYLINKNHDTFCPLGPAMVTPDEISDPYGLSMKVWIDGELRFEGDTSGMIHRIDVLISYLSSKMTLHPGDIILTGHRPLGAR
jgi:2-keto-4-pentenoate hydratase/2-oxohepta-3-ene-1,7-dioic acid hydratase in catechol pathway